jgi:hypothetical protein
VVTFTATVTSTFTHPFTPTPVHTPVIYPNPSNGGPFHLALPLTVPSDVRVAIFTVAFRKVQETTFSQAPVGAVLTIEPMDKWGTPLASGVYYVVAVTPQNHYTLKLLLIR